MRFAAIAVLVLSAMAAGCNGILGIEEQTFTPSDGGPDASMVAEAGGAIDGTLGPDVATPDAGSDAEDASVDAAEAGGDDTGSDGDDGATDAGSPLGTACSGDAGGGCASGFCVDGVCCESACAGQCEACDVADAGGTCAAVVSGAPHGSRPQCTGAAGTACAGACAAGNTAGCTYPGSSTSCRNASCTSGTETLAAGCNGSGGCPPPTTVTCNPLACNTAGTSCANACTTDSQCVAPTPYCNGGACLSTKANGETCTASSQCTNGHCIDGYCCNSACTDQCQACNVSGSLGACTQVPSGQPHGTRVQCVGAGGAPCGGSCTTASATACTYPTASCRAQSCTGSTETLGASCSNGSCPAAQTAPCSPYQCNVANTACDTSCAADADCVATDYCASNGRCTAQKAQGQACSNVAGGDCEQTGCRECTSGACVDGYCCNSSCAGECQACDVAGSAGACTTVASGQPHGSRAKCTGGGAAPCGGSCTAASAAACTYPAGTGCASNTPWTCSAGNQVSGAACGALVCMSGGCVVTEFYVSPSSGDDTAAGDQAHPLKTIGRAIQLVTSTGYKIIHLENGSYSAGTNGEGFPLNVPDGTTIKALSDGNVQLTPVSASSTALVLLGSATIEGVVLNGFQQGVTATTGTVSLTAVQLTNCINGFSFTGGTITISNSSVTGSTGTPFQTAFEVNGTSTVTATATNVTGPGNLAYGVYARGNLSLGGGTVTALGPDSLKVQTIFSQDNAVLSVNSVSFHDNGGGFQLRGNTSATILNSSIQSSSTASSGQHEIIGLLDNANVTMDNNGTNTASGPCILIYSAGVTLHVSHGALSFCAWGIKSFTAASVVVRNMNIEENTQDGINMWGAGLDLGTAASPGANLFQLNTNYGLDLGGTTAFTVSAVGNTWTASQQGADASGHYAAGTQITYPAKGPNVFLSTAGQVVSF